MDSSAKFDMEAQTAGRRPRILVVDDDDDTRTLVAIALRQDGYVVHEARDGAEALEYVAPALRGYARAPDLIVTDVCMPEIDGLVLLGGIRARGWLTPIILMTAYDAPAFRKRERALADAIFRKPFDLNELRATVAKMLWPTLA